MSFTYSGDPTSSPLDETRFLLGDTNSADPLLTNEEINYLLAQYGTPARAAAEGAMTLVAKFSRLCDESAGQVRVSWSQRVTHFKALYDRLSSSAFGAPIPFAGGISVSEKEIEELDTDRVTPAFTRGLHDTTPPDMSTQDETPDHT